MSEQLLDIGSAVAIVGLIISVVTLFLNQRKTKKELELTKEYLKTLSELVQTYRKGVDSQAQLQKERFEHEKLRDAAKALGWLWERSEE